MIIPMVCFTCGKPIAHLWIPYTGIVKKYELQAKSQPVAENADFLALKELKIGRLCCRRMFLAQHDMYTKVK